MIRILAVGKKHEAWVVRGIERYERRLKAPWNVKWELLPHSRFETDKARQDESEAILKRLSPSDYVILLDERGEMLDSPALATLFDTQFSNGKQITVIIGGAYGVSAGLHQRADQIISLSRLVLPHQLVRLILTEQLYRAQSIISGGKYHHE